MDTATKKLFAVVNTLEQKLNRLDELEKRLTALDTNGRLDSVRSEIEEVKRVMARVEANSQVVVNTVETHGDLIMRMEKVLTRLNLRCPLMKPDTGEFPDIYERVKLKDE